jgi:hypothetical protein
MNRASEQMGIPPAFKRLPCQLGFDIRLPTKVVSAVVGSSSELPDRTSTRAVGP